jgi:hypothetical protein
MSKILRRHWSSDFSGRSKSDRCSFAYETYVPDHLVRRSFSLDGDVAEAEALSHD